MKILFLAHRTPYPPNKGEKIRAFNLLSHLVKIHDVTLVYWVDDPRDLVYTPVLKALCRGLVLPVRMNRYLAIFRAAISLLKGCSFTQGFCGSSFFDRAVHLALRDGPFDAVFVFSSAMAAYAEKIECKTKIVDFVDVDSDKWGQLAEISQFPMSLLYRLEQKRLLQFENHISTWSSSNIFVSPADADLYRKQGGTGVIEVVPMCTELEVIRLPLKQMPYEGGKGDKDKSFGNPKLIFIGTLNYYPNADAVLYFAQEIFPLIRREFPKIQFEIVGRSPTNSVRQLNSIDGVHVVGEVPDVRCYLIQADVSVAPMRIARGVQSKVLEAIGLGVPVVATPAAIQGIEVCDGEEVLVGNNPEEFAIRVISLLKDAELRKRITKNAWNKMRQLYTADAIGAKLDKILARVSIEKSITA